MRPAAWVPVCLSAWRCCMPGAAVCLALLPGCLGAWVPGCLGAAACLYVSEYSLTYAAPYMLVSAYYRTDPLSLSK